MKPEHYTNEILDRKFQALQAAGYDPCNFIKGSRYWNVPYQFTIRQARDGFSFEYDKQPQVFQLKSYQLEKLRRAKPNQIICMTNSAHRHNNWYAVLLDLEEEQKHKERKARFKEIAQLINAQIGDLIKEQDSLRNKINNYKYVQRKL